MKKRKRMKPSQSSPKRPSTPKRKRLPELLSARKASLRSTPIGKNIASQTSLPAVAEHGALRLPSVEVDSYNIELKDDEGFIGDRASKGAFRDILEEWRKPLRKSGDDPFGDTPSDEIPRKTLDDVLTKGDPEAAGIVQSAIEDFSKGLARVIRRYLKSKAWEDTERVVIGGGFRATRVGELVVGRTAAL